jgi:hypothetical protein
LVMNVWFDRVLPRLPALANKSFPIAAIGVFGADASFWGGRTMQNR